jgi:hypothetical protein
MASSRAHLTANPAARTSWLGRATILCTSLLTLGIGGWVLLHRVPDLGPLAADAARAAIGDERVARTEDFAYGLQDRVNLMLHHGQAPRAHWHAAESPPSEAAPSFRPADVGPLFGEHAAPGDGIWTRGTPRSDIAYKTLIHPDRERSYSELFIVAIDLERVELHLAAGTQEPLNVAEGSELLERTGTIPESDLDVLFAAFNGGFKTRHGGFGMKVPGVALVPPKDHSCTVAQYEDGSLRIGTWHELPDRESITWLRQTPGCMVEAGTRHPKLEDSKSWGATLEGDTVIRRSAVGTSSDGKTLFVAISNATHAEALARGMQHVGAHNVAQLDVNHSYPRFLFYRDSGKLIEPLAEGFVVKDGHYVSDVSKRDFFYLTKKRQGSLAKQEATTSLRGG